MTGRFETVELNAAGWFVALAPASLIGGTAAFLATDSAVVAVGGLGFGALAGYSLARLWDSRRSDRQWSNIAVRNAQNAAWVLRSSGIDAAPNTVELDGATVHYVTTRTRDFSAAQRLVGLPTDSTRAERRARKAQLTVQGLPTHKPTSQRSDTQG